MTGDTLRNRTPKRRIRAVIDEDLLTAAQTALGTKTVKATIEQALLVVLRVRARAEEVEALSTLSGLDLTDAGVMAKAWRN